MMHRPRKIYIDTSDDKLFDSFQPSAHNRARQDLIETLMLERQLRETHEKLASDMAGITRSRLLALKAKERLGLTKPREEEVLVLK